MEHDDTKGGRFRLITDARGVVWKWPTQKAIDEAREQTAIIKYGSREAAERIKQEGLEKAHAATAEKRALRRVRPRKAVTA